MPNWAQEIRKSVRGAGLSPADEARIVEELSQHLEDRYEELLSRGSSSADAQRVALEELSAEQELSASLRDTVPRRAEPVAVGARTGAGRVASTWGDLRFGLRLLSRKPGFTAMAVGTLALGIGATTTIFSVFDAVVLRSLPFGESERLVQIWEQNAELDFGTEDLPTSATNFTAWREAASSLETLGAFQYTTVTRTGTAEPEQHWSVRVTPALFSQVLGVSPAVGRDFSAAEGESGTGDVVLISHDFWQRHYAGGESVLGRTLVLDGQPFTIIGIMPQHFRFPLPRMFPVLLGVSVDLWLPYRVHAAGSPYARNLGVVARLVPTTSAEAAEGQLNAVHPGSETGWAVHVVPLERQITGEVSPGLIMLLVAVSFVLLIACANVANLLLARGVARRREINVRAALGASRSRLVRQLLAEAALLALAGGAIGLGIAHVAVDTVVAMLPASFPRATEIAINGNVALFALVVSLATTLIAGGVPAFSATRRRGGEIARESPGTRDRRAKYLGEALVAVQVALAIVLLTGGALLGRSFVRLHQVELGFRSEHLMVGILSLPDSEYPSDASRLAFFNTALDAVRALPGVESASMSTLLPFSGSEEFNGFQIEGREPIADDEEPNARVYQSDPAYFPTLGISLVRGRLLGPTDRTGAPPVVVINTTMAEGYWPDEDPVGARISLGGRGWLTVVGVVEGVRYTKLESAPLSEMYLPLEQAPSQAGYLVVRTASDPGSLAPVLRATIAGVDHDRPLADLRTMDDMIIASMAERRLYVLLLGAFATVALALAAIGLYGVLAQAVGGRAQEIGVRMAIGARPRDVLRMVMSDGMTVVAIGMVAGFVGAIALTRLLRSMLFEISTSDPLSFLLVPAVLSLVALAAIYVPARRAMGVDPAITLREQ